MNTDMFTVGGRPEKIREATYRILSRSQDAPEVQVQAIAMTLVSLCQALNIDIKQLLISTERLKADLNGPFTTHFRALEEYARNEIGRR